MPAGNPASGRSVSICRNAPFGLRIACHGPPARRRSAPPETPLTQGVETIPSSSLRLKAPSWWTLALLAICALGAAPRLYVAFSNAIEYDGWWHIFIAQQDTWRNFAVEYRFQAHPPLFLLLLKLCMFLFGTTRLAYRATSIAASVASTFLIARIARRVTSHAAVSLLCALSFALSTAAVEIATEVRSYALAILFVLVAYDAFQRLLSAGCEQPLRELSLFSLAATLALLSHYFVVFFLGACAVVAVLHAFVDAALAARLRRATRAQWLRGTALLLPLLITGGVFYFFQAAHWMPMINYLDSFYFKPGGSERIGPFLWHNLRAEVALFSPLPAHGGAAILVPAALALAFLVLPLVLALRGGQDGPARAAPLLITLLQVSALAAASLIHAYPFGGALRHQFIVFPFALISLFVVFDRLLAALRWRPAVATALVAGGLAIGFFAYRGAHEVVLVPDELAASRVALLRSEFPASTAVYADTFSSIELFANLDRWSWRFVDGPATGMRFQRYELRLGGKRRLVLRDTEIWNADLDSPRLYVDLRDYLARTRIPSVIVFLVSQELPATPQSAEQTTAHRAQIERLAQAAGLRAARIELERDGALVELDASQPSPPTTR
jgi:hypothetical protein